MGSKAGAGTGGQSAADEEALLQALWAGALGDYQKDIASQLAADRARSKGKAGTSPAKVRNKYGSWFMPTGDWQAVYGGGSTEDEESIQARIGSVTAQELERRHVLEQQRANLQDELSKTYTVRVFREYMKDHNMREPVSMSNVSAASDRVIRERNAQHALHESRAGSNMMAEALLGATKQEGSSSKPDPLAGLTGARLLVDGIRPSDLDIDEIIAPEMREMVRRTVAMNDRLQEHAEAVAQMQQERKLRDGEWAKVLRARKAALAAANRQSTASRQQRTDRAQTPPASNAPSHLRAGTPHSHSQQLPGSGSIKAPVATPPLPAPLSAQPVATVTAPTVLDCGEGPWASKRNIGTPAKGNLRFCTDVEDASVTARGAASTPSTPMAGVNTAHDTFGAGDAAAERVGRQPGRPTSPGPYAPVQAEIGTPKARSATPGTPTQQSHGHGTSGGFGFMTEVPSLKLETLAERSDVPFGVRYLAALGVATAGAPPQEALLTRRPGSVAASPSGHLGSVRMSGTAEGEQTSFLVEQELRPGTGEEGRGGSKRWLHDKVPTLHSALQAAWPQTGPSVSPPGSQQLPLLQADVLPETPTASSKHVQVPGNVAEGSHRSPGFAVHGVHSHAVSASSLAIEATFGAALTQDSSEASQQLALVGAGRPSASADANSGHSWHHGPHLPHPHLHSRHPPHLQHGLALTPSYMEEHDEGGNLSMAWLSGEKVRRPTDKLQLPSAAHPSTSSSLNHRFSQAPASPDGAPSPSSVTSRLSMKSALQPTRPLARVQTAPHSHPSAASRPHASPDNLPRALLHMQTERKMNSRRFSATALHCTAWLQTSQRSPSAAAASMRRLFDTPSTP